MDITMLILSCDKFSDLWNNHVELLNKYWPNRNFKTYIVTDKERKESWRNVELMCTGKNVEFTDRLKYALSKIDTDYVFVTLDDYFLIQKVNQMLIDELLKAMEGEKLDYVRLFPNPKRATAEPIQGYRKLNRIETSDIYSVNLYAGIWRKSFMEKTIRETKNPWQYEVSLYKIANNMHAKCAVSNNNEFKILDVVRKGKILYGANYYMKRNGIIYTGNREVHSIFFEIIENTRAFFLIHMPKKMYYGLRKIFIKMGMRSISNDESL